MTESLIDIISRNVEAVDNVFEKAERDASRHHKWIERVTMTVGQPAAIYAILALAAAWIALNVWVLEADAPPFFWLQGAMSLCALLTTLMVLARQNRQAGLARQRAHLELQVNLLTEQKIAKLIELVEELRRDIPIVENRHDPVAEAMTETADPKAVLSTLDGASKR